MDNLAAEIRSATRKAGGQTAVAKRIGISRQRVNGWCRRGIPPAMVLRWCEAVDWRMTPHQVAPEIYPHPMDGLPVDRT